MSEYKSGYCYNIFIKEGPLNVVITPVNVSNPPLNYKNTELSALQVFTVTGFNEKSNISDHVNRNDILIAINGICFGAKLQSHSLEEWKNRLKQVSNPMIITFFRLDPKGELLLNPQRILFGSSFCHRGIVFGVTREDLFQLSAREYCDDLRMQDIELQEEPKQQNATIFMNDKFTLFTELNRFTSIIDQCFNWNVFLPSSRDVLNQMVANIRNDITTQSPQRYENFEKGLQLIKQSICQYIFRIRKHIEMNPQQAKQMRSLERTVLNLITTVDAILRVVKTTYESTTVTPSQTQPIYPQLSSHAPTRSLNVQSFQKAQPEEPQDAIGETNEMDFGETYNTEIFHTYMPQKVTIGNLHPDPVVETSALASVAPPDVFYKLELPQQIIDETLLSSLQLETVIYACQRHSLFSPQGYRYGFLLGDGAGMGKGRQLAGIIAENWIKGQHKAVWISESADLVYDCQRDLRDIGFGHIPVLNMRDSPYGNVVVPKTNAPFTEGVLFLTYSTIVSKRAGGNRGIYQSRYHQLLHWCGDKSFEGVIILDECHNAKTNSVVLRGSKKGSSVLSKTASMITTLQQQLPNARIVYSSATGGSDEKEMGYMERLGLWGAGTSYKNYIDLASKLSMGGLSFLEMLCCDMKAKGAFLSRQLSFTGCSFITQECSIDEAMLTMYNRSVKIWREMMIVFSKAMDIIQPYIKYVQTGKKDEMLDDDEMEGPISVNMIWRYYYACFQRFYKHMIMSSKIPDCIRTAQQAIKENKCVVIGLQSTGDSRTREMIDNMQEEELDEGLIIVKQFVSSPRQILLQLIENAFPMIAIPDSLLYDKSINENGVEQKASYYHTSFRTRTKRSQQTLEKLGRFLESSEEDASDEESGLMIESSESDEMEMEENDKTIQSPVTNEKSPHETKKELFQTLTQIQSQLNEMKEKLLTLVKSETFPLNPLDELIDKLGGETKVAEMTGRSYRILHHHPSIADSSTEQYRAIFEKENEGKTPTDEDLHLNEDYYFYSARGVKRGSEEGANMKEKQLFQKGEKKIAIISEAASAGISLHADRSVPNQRKRVHIILELPWSADKIIQQCGRSHRSNQRVPPDYVFLLSSIGGELRFVSTLSKRLKALGALTQGSRNATGALDFSGYDYDSTYARNAGTLMISTILNQESAESEPCPPAGGTLYLPGDYTYSQPMSEEEQGGYQAYQQADGRGRLYMMKTWLVQVGVQVNKTDLLILFFNRIMGLELFKQAILIAYLNEVVEKETYLRQQTEVLDQGLNRITGKKITLSQEPEVVFTDPVTHVPTIHYTIEVCRSISYTELMAMEKKGKFFKSGTRTHVIYAYNDTVDPTHWKANTELHIIRPATGEAANIWLYKDIRTKYKEVTDGQELWEKQWEVGQNQCIHGEKCSRPHCEQGKAIQTVHILSGQFVVLWGFIHDCVPRGKHLRLVQVSITDRDLTIMGVRIQASGMERLKTQLKNLEAVQKQEMKKQEELTVAYRDREEKQRLKELERKQREKERRKEREKAKPVEFLEFLEYGREKRIRKPLYRDPMMPPLIPICSFEEWRLVGMTHFATEQLKRDESMPALIALCHEDKRVETTEVGEEAGKEEIVKEESITEAKQGSSNNPIVIDTSSSGEDESSDGPSDTVSSPHSIHAISSSNSSS